MDNNKNKPSYARANAKGHASTEANRKNTTEVQPATKPWSRNSRHREHQSQLNRSDSARSSSRQNSSTSSSRVLLNADKRPRARGGGYGVNAALSPEAAAAEEADFDAAAAGTRLAEDSDASSFDGAIDAIGYTGRNSNLGRYDLNSVYLPGSKKQNLNHLLNFHYASKDSVHHSSHGSGVNGARRSANYANSAKYAAKPRYNKEQFLQANFQFVIRDVAMPKLMASFSPDALIDWDVIEQINLRLTEEVRCPICLSPPIAAKLTRCGHAYCWACILHYLALTDKNWRKCPICYESIHVEDLKSMVILQQQEFHVGEQITFNLMRRKKGSLHIEKHQAAVDDIPSAEYPLCSSEGDSKLFSKFLIAHAQDIANIIEREQLELSLSYEDYEKENPEYVFVQKAMLLLEERQQKLVAAYADKDTQLPLSLQEQQTKLAAINESRESLAEGAAGGAAAANHDNVLQKTIGHDTAKYYYFYQSVDGQNIYLHPLNVKMLQACYNSLEHAPLSLSAAIVQIEQHTMDEEHRRKFTCLGHLPLTCQFAIVEVDLQPPVISESVYKLFNDDVLARKKERMRREREELKREKKIDAIMDRQMGKLIASTAHLNFASNAEFPTFAFEPPLVSGSHNSSQAAVPTASNSQRSAPIATPKRAGATYSSAVAGAESPQLHAWPTLGSPKATKVYNSYQELSVSWGKPNMAAGATAAAAAAADNLSETDSLADAADMELAMVAPPSTSLGDVLEQAISQKKHLQQKKKTTANNANVNANAETGGKKHKKSKKMLPVFSNTMSFKK